MRGSTQIQLCLLTISKCCVALIICFVKVVLLTERGYEYEVSGDVRQPSWRKVFQLRSTPTRKTQMYGCLPEKL